VILGHIGVDIPGQGEPVAADRAGIHDDLGLEGHRPEPREDLVARQVRKAEVEDDEIGLVQRRRRDRGGPVAGFADDLEPAAQPEPLPKNGADLDDVIHQQHADLHGPRQYQAVAGPLTTPTARRIAATGVLFGRTGVQNERQVESPL
jgi:hypothetical protein